MSDWLRTRSGLVVIVIIVAIALAIVGAALDFLALYAAATLLVAAVLTSLAVAGVSVSRAVQALQPRVGDLEEVTPALALDVDELRTRNASHAARLDAVATDAEQSRAAAALHDEQIIDRIRRHEVRVTQLDRDLHAEIADERSARSLVLARRSAVPALDRLIVLMMLHRSESTRLHDLVRSHPSVVLDPSMRT